MTLLNRASGADQIRVVDKNEMAGITKYVTLLPSLALDKNSAPAAASANTRGS